MRRLLPALVLALTGSSLLVAPGASAMPTPLEPGAAAQAKVRCSTGLTAVDTEGRVRSQLFLNLRLREDLKRSGRLRGGVRAFGFFSSTSRGERNQLQLTAVTASGRPQLVTLDRTKSTVRVSGVRKFAQRGFTPRIFTDGYSFYAYTVDGDALKRWTLQRDRQGRIRYADPTRLGSGFGDVTAMTPAGIGTPGGVRTEALYATRADGSLTQIRVPLEGRRPKARTVEVATTGYAGVTGLAWSICSKPKGGHSLIAVVPGENRASLTAIARVGSKAPRATLVGDLQGVDDWNTLVATY